jgi:hypothetical protein
MQIYSESLIYQAVKVADAKAERSGVAALLDNCLGRRSRGVD